MGCEIHGDDFVVGVVEVGGVGVLCWTNSSG